ncbi:ABC transporter ATP-binding protein [Nanoarchaeota archaeon]
MERIIVNKISKQFKIGTRKKMSTLSRILSFFSGKEQTRILQALDKVSFKAYGKETLGIIGDNGSGKSTLLRIIAKIYNKDNGEIKTNGKIIPLINLKLGLNPRLTMEDNIYLICSILGLSKKQIKEKFESIAKFSDLKEFINTKIYQFSEGMKQKLVFSIAIHCNPEILLLDEIFEVGDENFKIKSAAKIKELVKQGATTILVSHDISLIKKHCHRVLWMKNGKLKKQGKTSEIIREYLKYEKRR